MSNADLKTRAKTRPPEGPPWDLPVEETPFAFVDLEMTGLDPTKDEIVEVCVERVVGDRVVGRFESLIRPLHVTTGPGTFVHGLVKEALDAAPPFSEIADEVQKLLDGAIFVAHGAEWDVRFLEHAFRANGAPREVTHFIDTIHLTRRAFVLASHSLDKLRAHFQIDTGKAHRAGADVAAMREVFRRVLVALAPKTARDLWEVRVGQGLARTEIIEACENAVRTGRAIKLVYRPSRRAAEELEVVLTKLEKTDGSARITGYHAASRGRVELRAERILSIGTPVK